MNNMGVINLLDRYWLILLLSSNVVAQYLPISSIGNTVFLASQIMGLVYCLMNIDLLLDKRFSQRFSFVYIFAAIYVIYQFTFGWIHINEKTWNYLFSKIVIDFSIALSVYKNRNLIFAHIPLLFAAVVPLLILIGFTQYDVVIEGRSTMGFGNPNSLGSLSAVTFGICIFCRKIRSKFVNYILASICLFASLMSGSRSAIGIIMVALLFKSSLRLKNILIVSLLVIGSITVPPMLGFNLVGINRLVETTQQENIFSANRESERMASILMIKENPITGNGLYAQQSEEAKKISELGSHNAYIDFIKMLGIPLGVLLVFFLIKDVYMLVLRYRKSPDAIKLHLFILVSGLIAANFEAYLWGVNHYVTTLFFVSICCMQQKYYEDKGCMNMC